MAGGFQFTGKPGQLQEQAGVLGFAFLPLLRPACRWLWSWRREASRRRSSGSGFSGFLCFYLLLLKDFAGLLAGKVQQVAVLLALIFLSLSSARFSTTMAQAATAVSSCRLRLGRTGGTKPRCYR